MIRSHRPDQLSICVTTSDTLLDHECIASVLIEFNSTVLVLACVLIPQCVLVWHLESVGVPGSKETSSFLARDCFHLTRDTLYRPTLIRCLRRRKGCSTKLKGNEWTSMLARTAASTYVRLYDLTRRCWNSRSNAH